MSQQQLAYEITKRSNASIWELAREEWKLNHIYESEEFDTCLCGHQIKEVCILDNKLTHAYAKVGNCCVKKFMNLPSDLIFQAVKRVRKDTTKSLNLEALNFALSKGWVSEWEYNFYNNIMSKRSLSEKQAAKKKQVNSLFLFRMKKPTS
jgi:hypothetical protein